ncbi:MAG: hypothetical protein RIF32_12965 [Leptospirales bacterium]|jgi:hypothetical protein
MTRPDPETRFATDLATFAASDVRAWARDLHRAGPGLLTGDRPIFALALGWQVILTLEGYRVHNIDGANRFNVFHLAGECMERGLPVEDVLNTITVQRVFTPYQVLDVVRRVAEDAIRERRSGQTKSRETKEIALDVGATNEARGDSPSGESVYFFLSPCKQFFDGDVGEEEGEFLLKRLLGIFRYMARISLPVMIVERGYDHPVFQRMYPELENLSGCHWPLAQIPNSEYHSGELSYGTYAGSLFHAD